jgi:2-amino-4-hydroxy-6-hydroxymethyldihydropteridine diphosphokinase
MAAVYVSIGSNIERIKHIGSGIAALEQAFGKLRLSPIYETPAEGFEGDAFYNLVAGFESDEPPQRLNVLFKIIEDHFGRVRGGEKFSSRTLDIDLLLYGHEVIDSDGVQVPRNEIERYSFVLQPLADLLPDQSYPGRTATFLEMWSKAVAEDEMKPAPVVELAEATKPA